MRIQTDDSIAVVVDIQERLVPAMADGQAMVERCRVLLQGLRILGVPCLASEQYPKGLGPTLPGILEVLPGVTPITKLSFSCLDEPAFDAALAASGRKTVLIAGMEAHVCVLQTAMDLAAAGYRPVMVVDALASRKPADTAIALDRFRQEGLTLATVESILFELTRTAGTDTFKAISKLVK